MSEKEFKGMHKAWFDGSIRYSQQEATVGAVILSPDGDVITSYSKKVEPYSSNIEVIEYLALLTLLRELVDLNIYNVVIFGDNKTVVRQMSNLCKITKESINYRHYCEAKILMSRLGRPQIRWVNRRRNKMADRMSRRRHINCDESVSPTL